MEALLTNKEMDLINKFAQLELAASHSYMFLANCMRSKGFFGAEKFFLKESDSERGHYIKWAKFVSDLGMEVETPAIESVDDDVDDLKDAMMFALEMEVDLLKEYEASCEYNISHKVKIKIQEFIESQVKSVGEYADLISRLSITNEPLLVDQELAK